MTLIFAGMAVEWCMNGAVIQPLVGMVTVTLQKEPGPILTAFRFFCLEHSDGFEKILRFFFPIFAILNEAGYAPFENYGRRP